ncbi:hypothetical protein LCGC14_2297020, partial [marine sediment metagenome]
VPDDISKYNITVTSSDGVYKSIKDPDWYSEDWHEKYNISIDMTAITGGANYYRENIKVDITGTNCSTNPNSTRVVFEPINVTVGFRYYNSSLTQIVLHTNQTMTTGVINKTLKLYCDGATTFTQANTTLYTNGRFGYQDFEENIAPATYGWSIGGSNTLTVSTDFAKEGSRSMKHVNADAQNYFDFNGSTIIDEIITFTFDWLMTTDTAYSAIQLSTSTSNTNAYIHMNVFNDGTFRYKIGAACCTTLFTHEANKWYTIKIVANTTSDTYSICFQNSTGPMTCVHNKATTGSTGIRSFIPYGSSGSPTEYFDRISLSVGTGMNQTTYWNLSAVSLDARETQPAAGDGKAPIVTLHSPDDHNWTSDSTPDFNFTYIDETNTTGSCTLWINGTKYGYNASIANNTRANFTANATIPDNAYYLWNITCSDGGNTNTSSRHISIDTTNPVIALNDPVDNFFWNGTTLIFNMTCTDMSPNTTINLLINSTGRDINNTVANNTKTPFASNGTHAEGDHLLWNGTCTDFVGNVDGIAYNDLYINYLMNGTVKNGAGTAVDNATVIIINQTSVTIRAKTSSNATGYW